MRIPSLIALLICVLLVACAPSVKAQETSSLYGKVRGQDHKQGPPPNWKANVYAVIAGASGSPISAETNDDSYCILVPVNAKVTLWFYSSGYVPKDLTPPIDTGENKPKHWVRPSPVILTLPKGNSLFSTPGGRRTLLDKMGEFAKATGALDLVRYGLGVMRSDYKDNVEATREIDVFINRMKLDQQFRPLMTPEREQRWELYNDIINRNRGMEVTIDAQRLLSLVKDDSVFSGIRSDATLALSTLALNSEIKAQALDYLRKQNQNVASALFASSTFALAKLGNATDIQSIFNDVNNADPERAIVALKTIGDAKLLAGSNTVEAIAKSGTANPAVREMAVQTLDELASSKSKSAVIALTTILADQKNPETLRVDAAEALNDVVLTSDQTRMLDIIATQDPSIDVRAAAAGAKNVSDSILSSPATGP